MPQVYKRRPTISYISSCCSLLFIFVETCLNTFSFTLLDRWMDCVCLPRTSLYSLSISNCPSPEFRLPLRHKTEHSLNNSTRVQNYTPLYTREKHIHKINIDDCIDNKIPTYSSSFYSGRYT